MKEYSPKAVKTSRAPESNPKTEKQAPISEISSNMALGRLNTFVGQNIIQGSFINGNNIKDIIQDQITHQQYANTETVPFLTVGFEHEFAQMTGDHPLKDVTHVELSNSTEKFGFTGLGFSLETDADNAIELVSPPFIMEPVANDNLIPRHEDVKKVDDEIQKGLTTIAGKGDIKGMIAEFTPNFGLTFSQPTAKITSSNINASTPRAIREREKEVDTIRMSTNEIKDIKIRLSQKSGRPGISGQLNFSTDGKTYAMAKDTFSPLDDKIVNMFLEIENKFYPILFEAVSERSRLGGWCKDAMDENMITFLSELAVNLSQTFAVPSLRKVEEWKEKLFDIEKKVQNEKNLKANTLANNLQGKYKSLYDLHTGIRSYVKDAHGIWLKDSIINYGLGILKDKQWFTLMIVDMSKLADELHGAVKSVNYNIFKSDEKKEIAENIENMVNQISSSLQTLKNKIIQMKPWEKPQNKLIERNDDLSRKPEFGGHVPELMGIRQDTFIPLAKEQKASFYQDKKMHVVEVRRGDMSENILKLELKSIIDENWFIEGTTQEKLNYLLTLTKGIMLHVGLEKIMTNKDDEQDEQVEKRKKAERESRFNEIVNSVKSKEKIPVNIAKQKSLNEELYKMFMRKYI